MIVWNYQTNRSLISEIITRMTWAWAECLMIFDITRFMRLKIVLSCHTQHCDTTFEVCHPQAALSRYYYCYYCIEPRIVQIPLFNGPCHHRRLTIIFVRWVTVVCPLTEIFLEQYRSTRTEVDYGTGDYISPFNVECRRPEGEVAWTGLYHFRKQGHSCGETVQTCGSNGGGLFLVSSLYSFCIFRRSNAFFINLSNWLHHDQE